MESTHASSPHVRFEIEKVIGISSSGNVRSYQVQWAPAWVSSFHLVGCEHLINDFLHQEQTGKENDEGDNGGECMTHNGDNCSDSLNVQINPITSSIMTEGHMKAEVVNSSKYVSSTAQSERHDPDIPSGDSIQVEVKRHNTFFEIPCEPKNNSTISDTETETTETCPEVIDMDSPTFRLNNISYFMQDTDTDGDGACNISEEDDPMLVSFRTSQKRPRPQPKQHHQQQRTRNIEPKPTKRTSMVNFRSDHFEKAGFPCDADTNEKCKPYVCETCDRGFSQRHHLKEHLRTHTGDKPFTCEVCEKTFTQRGTLNRHILTHVKHASILSSS